MSPASPPVPARPGRSLWPVARPVLLALGYAFGHLAWYRTTPLGQVPVLDEQENLVLAEAIVRGELPKEPFYRAPGYALLLALLRVPGVSTQGLFPAALVLGVVLHALNAGLAAHLARSWFGRGAGLTAGLLLALHPVFVHYATQALDGIAALTFFLGALACIPWNRDAPRAWRWAAASICCATATFVRPNYLLVWCALPIAAWGLTRGTQRRVALAACSAGAAIFAGVAGWQHRVSGVAGFLPWQGAYNLWAANEPGTHGRYYLQRHTPPSSSGTINPARADSFYLYFQAKGAPPADIAALNGYWRERFIAHVRTDPVAWLAQLLRKTYALLNNWEQYNNKTFAFHQARSPWLRWNPLGWGILFVLGAAGAARLSRDTPRIAAAVALIAGACAAGIVLFFVSARFRLPLGALATILAGGALAAPRFWRAWPARAQAVLGVALVLVATLTFSRFDGVADPKTMVEDHALIARAASTIDQHAVAWAEATAALARHADHPDARFVATAAYFNLLVRDQAVAADEPRWREICARLLASPGNTPRELRAIAAVAQWRGGNAAAAIDEWQRLGASPSAVAARLLAGDRSVTPRDLASAPPASWQQSLVRLAAAHFDLPPPPGVTTGNREQATAIVRRLFSAGAAAPRRP